MEVAVIHGGFPDDERCGIRNRALIAVFVPSRAPGKQGASPPFQRHRSRSRHDPSPVRQRATCPHRRHRPRRHRLHRSLGTGTIPVRLSRRRSTVLRLNGSAPGTGLDQDVHHPGRQTGRHHQAGPPPRVLSHVFAPPPGAGTRPLSRTRESNALAAAWFGSTARAIMRREVLGWLTPRGARGPNRTGTPSRRSGSSAGGYSAVRISHVRRKCQNVIVDHRGIGSTGRATTDAGATISRTTYGSGPSCRHRSGPVFA